MNGRTAPGASATPADRQSAPRISLIVPAHNEEHYLPRLLDTVDAARARYRGGPGAVEVIVADNASTDRTAELARERGCRVVSEPKRVIAAVRNAGARAAAGAILSFLDADMRIHEDTFNEIERALSSGKVVAGSTGARLERWSLGIAVIYATLMPFIWLLRIDTGVVFCRRDDFQAIGGYDETMIVAEDVRFLWDLKRLGWRRGQRLTRIRRAKALASTRKFDVHGDWHYFLIAWLAFRTFVLRRRGLEEFANRYWYGEQRRPDTRSPG